MKKDVAELLAPAGSYEGFEAVLGAGADAVYVGGAAFGARAYAKNFDTEELVRAIKTAHLHDRKLYLTVNTLLKNREMEQQLLEYLKPYYEAGLDAVLVQDFGVVRFIQEHFPELPIHASTQMAVTGPEGMKLMEQQGLTRIVAARELSLTELARMHRESPLEIETFVHGALCYCYSGRCLMSSIFGGRSGNRGRCAQPCRLPYQTALGTDKFTGGKELCPLSLKDMNTLAYLPEILEAGVYSLKIEGRMKQPTYAAGVTAVYRRYLDLLLEKGPEAYRVDPKDQQFLTDLFSRGGSYPGYYDTYNGPEMMAFSNEKKTGNVNVETVSPKTAITGDLFLGVCSPAMLTVRAGDCEVTAAGEMVQPAEKQPMGEERIRQQMEKMGGTPFVWENLDITILGDIFVPVKQLNELRRNAVASLYAKLASRYERVMPEADVKSLSTAAEEPGEMVLTASCTTEEQLITVLADANLTRVYVPLDLAEQALAANALCKELFLLYPEITRHSVPEDVREKTMDWLSRGYAGVLVRDLESAAALLGAGLGGKLMLDSSLYSWNDEALRFWEEKGVRKFTAPLELNGKELRHRDNHCSEMVLYGYLPLMVSAQCIRKNRYGCNHRSESTRLKDRMGTEFTAQCVCDPWKGQTTERQQCCYNIIYNSLPLALHGEAAQVKRLGMASGRLAFTTESGARTQEILEAFAKAYLSDEPVTLAGEFTKGHLKRGAE